MKVSGNHAVNPDWFTPTQAAQTGATKVTINPEVENYRLIAGASSHGVQLLDHALNYSLSMPLKQRGITKIVLDNYHYERVRNHLSTGQPLHERLLQEGIEILLLDDVVAFIDKHYPRFSTTIKFFAKLNRRTGVDDPLWAKAVMSGFYHDLITFFLPHYAFSTSQNRHLKVVTVCENSVLNSLFMPATAAKGKAPARFFLGAVSRHPNIQQHLPSFIIDANALPYVMVPHVRTSGVFANSAFIEELKLTIFPRHCLWIQSRHFARKLARQVNLAITNYLTQPLLLQITRDEYLNNENNFDFFSRNSKTLDVLSNDNSLTGSMLCHQFQSPYNEAVHTFKCWNNELHNFYQDLRLRLIITMNVQLVLPSLKMVADSCNVKYIEPSFSGLKNTPPDNTSYVNSDFALWLSHPTIGLYSNHSADTHCLLQQFFLQTSDDLKLKYFLEKKLWLRGAPPICIPVFNTYDINRIIASTNQAQELIKISNEIARSYPSETTQFCRTNVTLTPVSNTPSAPSPLPVANAEFSAFTSGMITGMVAASADRLGHGYVLNHPIARGALGYCSAGLAGLGLSICGWALHNYLPHRLRTGAEPGSFRHNCATMVETLSIAVPMLIGGIHQCTACAAGFLLGNYGTEAALGKIWPTQPEAASRQKSTKSGNHPNRQANPTTTPTEPATTSGMSPAPADDSVAFRNQMLSNLLDSAEPLPWHVPGIDGLVVAHARRIQNREERTDYLEKQLQQCEQTTGGVLSAVSLVPGLYGEYLQTQQNIDVERAKGLWTVLTPDSAQELLSLVGKTLIQNSLNNNEPVAALATMNDPRLTGEASMKIINDLCGTEILFQNEVPEKLARAYLAQVNLKERKQKNPAHIVKAANRWLQQFQTNPNLTDNLIHLTYDLKLTGHDGDWVSAIFHDFRRTLKHQAEVEVRYLPGSKHRVQRYLRAKAIEIALQESHH